MTRYPRNMTAMQRRAVTRLLAHGTRIWSLKPYTPEWHDARTSREDARIALTAAMSEEQR